MHIHLYICDLFELNAKMWVLDKQHILFKCINMNTKTEYGRSILMNTDITLRGYKYTINYLFGKSKRKNYS